MPQWRRTKKIAQQQNIAVMGYRRNLVAHLRIGSPLEREHDVSIKKAFTACVRHCDDLGKMPSRRAPDLDGWLLTPDDTMEFFSLILELKLGEQDKKDIVAFLRQL